MQNKKYENYKAGLIAAIGCSCIWGVLPIYWNLLKPIDSFVILCYRNVLMALLCFILSWYKFGLKDVFKPMFESKKKFFTYVSAGIVITFNWGFYIWAVNSGHILQSSMGYFLEPIIICFFGIFIYKERPNKFKIIAMLFAFAGLMVMIIGYHTFPFVAVSIGLSFATYAAIKKSVHINPIQSLLFETVTLVPVALYFILNAEFAGAGAFSVGSSSKIFLLALAGIVTAVPLGLFGYAAANIPLITLGVTEYISPSIALILGIFLYNEPFKIIDVTAFSIIWIGLVFFTAGEMKDSKKLESEN